MNRASIEPPKLITPTLKDYEQKRLIRQYDGIAGQRCTMVTLYFPTTNYQVPYYFASQTILDGENATITAIEVVRDTDPGVLARVPNGDTNFLSAYLPFGVLYMSNVKREIIAEIPLTQLDSTQNSGKKNLTWFDDQVWHNCYVMFLSNTFTIPTIPLTFMVWYLEKTKN